MLGTTGYKVISFGSADEAMEDLKQGELAVDLLLTDVVLPGVMQGNDLVRNIQNSRPDLPVLYMSGYARDAIVHAGRLDEGVNFLEKPVHEPFFRGLGGAPWWMFTGGLIGAVFVATQTFLVPRLGAAGLIAGIIAGLLIGSIVIDRFGLFGLQRHAVSAPRLVGAALLVGGAGLVIWR